MFSATAVEGYHDAIRALCAGVDSMELPDATIDLPPYAPRIVRWINLGFPTYSALLPDQKSAVEEAFCFKVAALLCRTFCKGRAFRLDNSKVETESAKVDWDALADALDGQAAESLDALDTSFTPIVGLTLAPSLYNPVTQEYQPLITS